MSYVDKWLTEKEKNNISGIQIYYDVNKINIWLKVLETLRRFRYSKAIEGITTVVDVEKEQETWIKKYFVDVACEDFDLLVANQKTKLQWLDVKPVYYTDYDKETMDPIISKIFENLSKSVASRPSPLQITDFDVYPTKVSEVMSVIRHLDQSKLRNVTFEFEKRNEPGKIDDTMIDWNGDSGWKCLWFYLDTFTREDSEGLSKIASSQRFDRISVHFKSRDKGILAFFDTKVFNLETFDDFVWIKPLISRPNPFSDEKKTFQLKSIDSAYKKKTSKLESVHLGWFSTIVSLIGDFFSSRARRDAISEKLALEVLGNPVIMETILGELEIFDIQRLRKVCKGVRECIDDVKPEPHINAYEIKFSQYEVSVMIGSKHETKWIYYNVRRKDEGKFFMKELHQEYPYEYQEYLYDEKRALNDFHINLLHQTTCLEKLQITSLIIFTGGFFGPRFVINRAATYIRELLRGRKTALKVKNLMIDTSTVEDVMQILPFIDKDSLKKIIIIHRNRYISDKLSTDVAEIARTEQWKRAIQLSIEESTVTTPIQEMDITHFSTVDILMETMSTDEVVYLKTELLKSSTFEKFKIKFRTFTIDEKLYNLIGEPYRITPNFKKIWYFRMPNADYYLHIALDTQDLLDEKGNPKPKTIVFAKVAKEDTPFY